MLTYRAPLEEYRFVLHELFDYDGVVASLPGYEEGTSDLADAVIEECAKFCENELMPLYQSGDAEGCTFENGEVRTPKGFKQAYDAFVEAGWPGLAASTEYGGQGLPKTLQLMLDELVCSTNLSFGIYPGLSHGAYNAIELHGTDDQKALYLPKIAEGTWSGTMCLTEPQCGTDLGLIRTKAEPRDDDAYAITGTKVFISAGEHDLTENIIHLVLARLPDAPPGIKGISLFIVPKFLPNGSSGPGPRNAVECGAIEHKMGIHASSTCVMNFDGAAGFLIGEKHKGMRCMFTMMNAARLAVSMQGLGLAETAYQSAVAYARDRVQGRSLNGAKYPDKPADPIIVHPDIRRTLMSMRACNEAARALAIWLAMALDRSERHPDAEKRQEADDLVALLTPVVKAYFTDHGFDATNAAVQIHGGHGYIREHGVEQLVRDARIAQIYEGANGIQALDLVGRKLPLHAGRLLRRFFHPVSEFIEENMEDAELAEYVMPLAKAFARLQQATAFVAHSGLKDADEAGAAASDYLRFFALVALGYMWALMAKEALARKSDGANGTFYDAKLATARFFMKRVLPETSSLNAAIMAGADSVMEMPEDWF